LEIYPSMSEPSALHSARCQVLPEYRLAVKRKRSRARFAAPSPSICLSGRCPLLGLHRSWAIISAIPIGPSIASRALASCVASEACLAATGIAPGFSGNCPGRCEDSASRVTASTLSAARASSRSPEARAAAPYTGYPSIFAFCSPTTYPLAPL